MKSFIFYVVSIILVTSCTSTVSFIPSEANTSMPLLAVMPLEGEYGTQAADMITQELIVYGYRVLERSQIDPVLQELGYSGDRRFDPSSLPKIGKQLGVRRLFVGSITTIGGPLYSYPHANISLRLVEVATGKILWTARYGNPMWSSAISTQGDIQRGARDLVREFTRTFGSRL
jgi:TolB-like protein